MLKKKSGSHLNNPPTQLFCIKLERDSAPAWNALGLAPNRAGLSPSCYPAHAGLGCLTTGHQGLFSSWEMDPALPSQESSDCSPKGARRPQPAGTRGPGGSGDASPSVKRDTLRHLLFLPEFLDSQGGQQANSPCSHISTLVVAECSYPSPGLGHGMCV